jgi:hypothetical protein
MSPAVTFPPMTSLKDLLHRRIDPARGWTSQIDPNVYPHQSIQHRLVTVADKSVHFVFIKNHPTATPDPATLEGGNQEGGNPEGGNPEGTDPDATPPPTDSCLVMLPDETVEHFQTADEFNHFLDELDGLLPDTPSPPESPPRHSHPIHPYRARTYGAVAPFPFDPPSPQPPMLERTISDLNDGTQPAFARAPTE